MNLWSKVMFAIRREGEHFSFYRNEVNEREREHLHTQLDVIVYICGSLCKPTSAFMYNFSIHCVTGIQFGGEFILSGYNVTFLSSGRWIKVFQSNLMLSHWGHRLAHKHLNQRVDAIRKRLISCELNMWRKLREKTSRAGKKKRIGLKTIISELPPSLVCLFETPKQMHHPACLHLSFIPSLFILSSYFVSPTQEHMKTNLLSFALCHRNWGAGGGWCWEETQKYL